MTPERRAQVVNTLRTNAAHSGIPNACRDAADELEATAALRADLAKATERIAELEADRNRAVAALRAISEALA